MASDPVPSVAPANPKFVTYIEDLASHKSQETTEDGRALGLVPLPVEIPHVKPKPGLRTMALLGMPATYDLRTQDRVTNVKDQSTCGSCWAFAAYGSMESSIKPSETWDFSENNLKNLAGFDLNPCDGGNHLMATAYLARWDGPVAESDDPYNPGSSASPAALPALKHLQGVDFIPDRNGPTDNDTIKRAVMAYGAVYTSLYWGSAYYKSSTYAYCSSGSHVSNHAVCIVGWDDNYDKNRFVTPPAGNGAFLIKNSWGPYWGLEGYFYISYYDTNIGADNAQFRVAEPTINYNHIYQYDTLGWTTSAGYGANTACFANVFTATSGEELNAVSIYTPVPDSTYEMSVYLEPNSGPINTAGPAAIQTGSIPSAGYQTIQLNPSVALSIGQRFSVVMKLTTPNYTYPIPLETASNGYSSRATSNSGESYMSSSGTSWTDVTTPYPHANVCLKAFTADRAGLQVSPAPGFTATGSVGGPFTPSSQVYTLRNIGSTNLDWTASKKQSWLDFSADSGVLTPGDATNVTVSVNAYAGGMQEGSYSDTILFINETGGAGSTSRTVNLLIKDGSLAVTQTSGLVSYGEEHGPFTPVSQVYTLVNNGYSAISWTAMNTQPWVSLSAVSGSITPGARVDVTVSINANANNLAIGNYADAVTFTNTTNGDGSTSRNVSLSIIRNYEMSSTAFNWIDPSNHTSFLLSDDGVTSAQTIPFTFSFYGVAYSQVYIGANGLMGFVNTGISEYNNSDLPNPQVPNAAIYPYWDDLDPGTSGLVRVGMTGTAPARKMVISWVGVPHFSSTAPLSFQVILCETTGTIIFQYQEVQPGNASFGAGRSATVGLENATGAIAQKYSFNGSAPLLNGQAILFTTNLRISIPEAKRLANGVACTIRDAIVTAVASTTLVYAETEDRACGIAVYKSQHGLTLGEKIDIVGTMTTNSSGEKFINAVEITPTGETVTVKPVAMANNTVGGADWFYDPGTKAGQKGIKGSIYTNNIGMLITTMGTVTYSTTGYFYIDDGSKCKDNSTYTGIKVLGTVPVTEGEDPVGKYVIVTGANSCFKGTSPDIELYRLIRATEVRIVN